MRGVSPISTHLDKHIFAHDGLLEVGVVSDDLLKHLDLAGHGAERVATYRPR